MVEWWTSLKEFKTNNFFCSSPHKLLQIKFKMETEWEEGSGAAQYFIVERCIKKVHYEDEPYEWVSYENKPVDNEEER